MKSENFTSITELQFSSQQLYHTQKKRSFSDNIDTTPISVKLTKTLREEVIDRSNVLIGNQLHRHCLDGAALDHTKLQSPIYSYCHDHKISSHSNYHMKTSIAINGTGIRAMQKIVAYPSFHASGKPRFETVMVESDEVCEQLYTAREQNHGDTKTVWFAKVLSFISLDINEEDRMESSSNFERSTGTHKVAFVQ